MDDRPGEVEKTRVSVTMTKTYLDALDHLIEEGVYLSRGEIILEALRILLRQQGIEPFRLESVEESEEPE
jgi:Arc/MetJ-type ribon-helix-helix transcriptional regulator